MLHTFAGSQVGTLAAFVVDNLYMDLQIDSIPTINLRKPSSRPWWSQSESIRIIRYYPSLSLDFLYMPNPVESLSIMWCECLMSEVHRRAPGPSGVDSAWSATRPATPVGGLHPEAAPCKGAGLGVISWISWRHHRRQHKMDWMGFNGIWGEFKGYHRILLATLCNFMGI